mmetsp:Transcript_37031/g.105861  ORF Transcript_37031/g.105861 Transcript_37031/m.105861 type:complete len:224 (-) Transcript_37031:13-684(-)
MTPPSSRSTSRPTRVANSETSASSSRSSSGSRTLVMSTQASPMQTSGSGGTNCQYDAACLSSRENSTTNNFSWLPSESHSATVVCSRSHSSSAAARSSSSSTLASSRRPCISRTSRSLPRRLERRSPGLGRPGPASPAASATRRRTSKRSASASANARSASSSAACACRMRLDSGACSPLRSRPSSSSARPPLSLSHRSALKRAALFASLSAPSRSTVLSSRR